MCDSSPSAAPISEPPGDIRNREDIVRLVDHFYDRVRGDARLGPIFGEAAQVDWESHLPKMHDFWDTVIFRSGTYRGDLIGAHARLVSRADMSLDSFRRWVELFEESVHELYQGERAEWIVRCAEDMAHVIFSKIHGVPDPRFTPSASDLT